MACCFLLWEGRSPVWEAAVDAVAIGFRHWPCHITRMVGPETRCLKPPSMCRMRRMLQRIRTLPIAYGLHVATGYSSSLPKPQRGTSIPGHIASYAFVDWTQDTSWLHFHHSRNTSPMNISCGRYLAPVHRREARQCRMNVALHASKKTVRATVTLVERGENEMYPHGAAFASCEKCGHVEWSHGEGESSIKRSLYMLSQGCPAGNSNFYVEWDGKGLIWHREHCVPFRYRCQSRHHDGPHAQPSQV